MLCFAMLCFAMLCHASSSASLWPCFALLCFALLCLLCYALHCCHVSVSSSSCIAISVQVCKTLYLNVWVVWTTISFVAPSPPIQRGRGFLYNALGFLGFVLVFAQFFFEGRVVFIYTFLSLSYENLQACGANTFQDRTSRLLCRIPSWQDGSSNPETGSSDNYPNI